MPPYPVIPLEFIRALPLLARFTIDETRLDAMGHMNVRHYLGLFDDAAWPFFGSFGMTLDYYRDHQAGAFALEHHIRYLAEVRAGETVALYGRILGRSEKRIHFMAFMVNDDKAMLSATLEAVGSHADLTLRRTSPYPPHIAEKIDVILHEHEKLGWDAPICGVISA